MARKTGGSGVWRWSSTAGTREAFLDAARDAFGEKGFSETSIADVVERTGLSVGSLYHHFGAKGELFLALYERHHAEQEDHASRAVADARARGMDNRLELFLAGARAYLDGAWQRRDLMRIFLSGDTPSGFESARHTRIREWIRRSAALLDTTDDVLGHLTVSTLTSLINEAAHEVAASDDEKTKDAVVEATETLIRRLKPLY